MEFKTSSSLSDNIQLFQKTASESRMFQLSLQGSIYRDYSQKKLNAVVELIAILTLFFCINLLRVFNYLLNLNPFTPL